jgi:hypothetical protein
MHHIKCAHTQVEKSPLCQWIEFITVPLRELIGVPGLTQGECIFIEYELL